MKRVVLTIAVMMGWVVLLHAQFTETNNYKISNTIGPGISDEWVEEMIYAQDGKLIMATQQGGLSIFDGSNWDVLSSQNGFINDYIEDIAVDAAGNLWVCTKSEVIYEDQGTWVEVPGISLPSRILIDQSNSVWVGTDRNGVYHQTPDGGWVNYTMNDGLVSNAIFSLLSDDNQNIWIGTNNGLSKFDGNNFINYSEEDGLVHKTVRELGQDDIGRIWAASWFDGISVFDGTEWTYPEQIKWIRDMYVDDSDTLWIIANRGIYKYKDGDLSQLYNSYSFGAESVGFSCMAKDGDGTLFIGTLRHGLLEIAESGSYQFYHPDFGMISNQVLSITGDPTGEVWLGTERGISIFQDDVWEVLEHDTDIPAERIEFLYVDNDSNIWSSASYGLLQFDGLENTLWDESSGLLTDYVWEVFQDENGLYWFATSEGVSRFDGIEWMHLGEADGLVDPSIDHIFGNIGAGIWFGNDEYLYRYRDGVITTFLLTDLLSSSNAVVVREIMIDREGRVWVVTNRGLIKYEDEDWWHSGLGGSGLSGKNIYDIFESEDGDIWIVGYNEVARYLGQNKFIEYSEEDGIFTTGGLSSGLFDLDGHLWLGTFEYGVFIYEISTRVNETIPKASFIMYPNPTIDDLTLESNIPILAVSIYDLNGRQLFYQEVQGTYGEKIQIRPKLQPGMYMCQVHTNTGTYSQKLIIAEH